MNITSTGSGAPAAVETIAQTRIKAAQGDIQAKMKLAMLDKLSSVRPPAPVAPVATDTAAKAATPPPADTSDTPSEPPPPTGAVLNVKR